MRPARLLLLAFATTLGCNSKSIPGGAMEVNILALIDKTRPIEYSYLPLRQDYMTFDDGHKSEVWIEESSPVRVVLAPNDERYKALLGLLGDVKATPYTDRDGLGWPDPSTAPDRELSSLTQDQPDGQLRIVVLEPSRVLVKQTNNQQVKLKSSVRLNVILALLREAPSTRPNQD